MPVFKTVSPAGLQAALLKDRSKDAQNASGALIHQFAVCAWTDTGTVQLASALTMHPDSFAGIANADVANNAFGLFLRDGKLPGAVSTLNAVPGQPVFLSESAGQMTLDTSGFSEDSTILKLGYAEPPDGETGAATDLLIAIEYIAES